MTTWGAMRTQIAKELGDPDDSRWTLEIEQRMADAIRFYRRKRFWFNEDRAVQSSDVTSMTADGTEYYAFPTNPTLIRLDSLRILANSSDPYPLKRELWETIEAWATLPSVSKAIPTCYAVRGEEVRLYAIPDGTYTLYWAGVFNPTALTVGGGDNQTNVWMTDGADLIRNRAKKLMARDRLADGIRAATAELAEDEALTALIDETDVRLRTGRNRPQGPGTRNARRRW